MRAPAFGSLFRSVTEAYVRLDRVREYGASRRGDMRAVRSEESIEELINELIEEEEGESSRRQQMDMHLSFPVRSVCGVPIQPISSSDRFSATATASFA